MWVDLAEAVAAAVGTAAAFPAAGVPAADFPVDFPAGAAAAHSAAAFEAVRPAPITIPGDRCLSAPRVPTATVITGAAAAPAAALL